jgi:hypothetical protein
VLRTGAPPELRAWTAASLYAWKADSHWPTSPSTPLVRPWPAMFSLCPQAADG